MTKSWSMACAIGYGMVVSLALTGAARITCLLIGATLPDDVASNIFLASSLAMGSLSAYLFVRFS